MAQRMTTATKERLAEAAQQRKYRERSERGEVFRKATPRLVLRPHPRYRETHSPDLIHVAEVRFNPAHDAQAMSMNLSGRGPLFGPKRTEHRPDTIFAPSNSIAVKDLAGRFVKPLAADLRRYDTMGERIRKMQA